MATLYNTNGEVTSVEIGEDHLKSYYDLIGCEMVEAITIDEDTVLLVDEESRLKQDQQINLRATEYVRKYFNMDCIIGNALLVTVPDEFN
jgi:hypothetical protein